MRCFDKNVGVSVTRAFKFHQQEAFDYEDASNLLTKKLKGIKQSFKNALRKWDKHVLHVWTLDTQAAEVLIDVWSDLSDNLKSNTILFITITNSVDIFINHSKK